MALGTEAIMTSLGIPAYFWTIPKVELDRFAKQGAIIVYGYINKQHSDNNNGKYLERLFINIYPDKFDEYFDLNILKKGGICDVDMAYKFVKENLEKFKSAIDLIYDDNGNLINNSESILNISEVPQDIDDYNDYELYGIEI